MSAIHVPPEWSGVAPKLAFVGEAPSDEELDQLRPLVGPSGRVFNGLLRTAGIRRENSWIGNVFDEKLPDNDVSAWCAPAGEAREGGFDDLQPIGSAGYLRPEYRWHLVRLADELRAANPTVIVPLGSTAIWAFTGDTGISLRRGSAQAADHIVPGRKLVPTYHPAMVLRQWSHWPVVAKDLLKAAAEAERGPNVIYPERHLCVDPTIQDLIDLTPLILGSKLLCVDIETGWGQITNIGFAWNEEDAINVPFFDRRKANNSYWETVEEEREAWRIVRAWCESPAPKLGQFAGTYDAYWLWHKYGIALTNYAEDTRLKHHAFQPELPKDLAFLGATYGSQGPWKVMGRRAKRDD